MRGPTDASSGGIGVARALQMTPSEAHPDMPAHSEPLSAAGTSRTAEWLRRDRPIMAYGLMLLVAVSLVLNRFTTFPSLPDEVASTFRKYRAKKVPLQIETSDLQELESYFAGENASFTVRNPDPATYTLKGGSVQRMVNRKTCWCAFEGRGNRGFVLLVCPGNVTELVPPQETRRIGDLELHIYFRREVTMVLWQEATRCLALASDSAEEEVIRLAQATAKR